MSHLNIDGSFANLYTNNKSFFPKYIGIRIKNCSFNKVSFSVTKQVYRCHVSGASLAFGGTQRTGTLSVSIKIFG